MAARFDKPDRRFALRKVGRFWRVTRDDVMVYENGDYAKAVGVFDYLAFWSVSPAKEGSRQP